MEVQVHPWNADPLKKNKSYDLTMTKKDAIIRASCTEGREKLLALCEQLERLGYEFDTLSRSSARND